MPADLAAQMQQFVVPARTVLARYNTNTLLVCLVEPMSTWYEQVLEAVEAHWQVPKRGISLYFESDNGLRFEIPSSIVLATLMEKADCVALGAPANITPFTLTRCGRCGSNRVTAAADRNHPISRGQCRRANGEELLRTKHHDQYQHDDSHMPRTTRWCECGNSAG